ncbi:hypothetical protein Tco_0229049, partial [Tanacetum coccineum]
GFPSRVGKGKGAIAFWAGPNLVVWARYAFWARGHVATIAVLKKKKHKPKVKKPKKLGSKERLASPKPSEPRNCLRWSPTRKMFDLKGKIVVSSESTCQSDSSKGRSNLFMVRRLGMLKAYDRKSEASYKFCLEVSGNGSL